MSRSSRQPADSGANRPGAPAGMSEAVEGKRLKERILILDDEKNILDVLREHLTEEDYDCTTTTSPLQALELIRQDGFSLLVTDLKMPEMHGIDLVVDAKKLDPDLAIVVITAMIDVKLAIQALRIGADDYLLKPFNLSEISLSVARVLEKRALIIENRQYQRELESRVKEATHDLERANRELRNTKEYLENLIHSTVDAIITCDPRDRVSFVNEGGLRMLGYRRDEIVGQPMGQFYSGGADEARHVRRLMGEGTTLQNYETELKHRNARFVPVNMSLSHVHNSEGELVSTLAICKDITQQKRLEAELKEMSIKDSLTCLYNQRYFYDRLASEIERSRRQNHPLSLLLLDVDQFKTYNDCHGHLEGDNVLQTVGAVIQECTREHVDMGFRYGGDEFTAILPEADEAQASQIAERIRASFEAKHFDALTLSIGVMTYRQEFSQRTFIKFTDAMMYDAKRSGGNRVYVFRPQEEPQEESEQNG